MTTIEVRHGDPGSCDLISAAGPPVAPSGIARRDRAMGTPCHPGATRGAPHAWAMLPLLALAAAAGPLFAKFAGAIALARCACRVVREQVDWWDRRERRKSPQREPTVGRDT